MTAKNLVPLAARILLAGLFLWAGWGKIGGFEATVARIGAKGLPIPQLLAACAIVLELIGALMLVLGWRARWAALALAGVCLFTAVVFHNFWAVPADQVAGQQIHFLKNLSILGGMLLIWVYGSGPIALREDRNDARAISGRVEGVGEISLTVGRPE